ncbi:MAG: DEAD/DEAH box helicase [Bacteroidetes bacterium]|nr:DEAD/DEAH box helicase [Bacteroidota bacterium]
MKFSEFNLDPGLQEGIDAFGFENATPVQEKAIPVILEGKDIIASAQTGTGKTAAFLLPVIDGIIRSGHEDRIQALIIVPTRELAMQIDQQLEGLSYYTPVSSIAVYGGTDGKSFINEKIALTQGAAIVIGTPGRLLAHLNMDYVKLNNLKYLILDEADRMLDMGFFEDIMRIISHIPEKRQNLLFSATMPPKIRELAKKVLHDPLEISIAISKPVDKVLQVAYVMYDRQKVDLARYLLQGKELRSILIFCSTKSSVKQLNRELKNAGMASEEIHSDLEQSEREKVLREFRSRKISILVATDVLSRGIDIEDIDLVINYDVPGDAEDYIHRIGRTARAEAEGVAITFIGEKEQRKFSDIERLLGNEVMKLRLPAHLGETPPYNPGKAGHFSRNRVYHKKRKK